MTIEATPLNTQTPAQQGAQSNLITNKAAQRERIAAKRKKVLDWLAVEGFSTVAMLAKVLEVQHNAAYKTCKAMEAEGLVAPDAVQWLGHTVNLVTLTAHGAMMHAEPGQDFDYHQRGKVAASTVAHAMDIQTARLAAIRAGWTDWQSDHRNQIKASKDDRWLKVPDALAKTPEGELIAIEIERTSKTTKRYQDIIGAYLQLISKGMFSRVVYVSPTPGLAARLQALFARLDSFTAVNKQGQLERFPLTDSRRSYFSFQDLEGWPK